MSRGGPRPSFVESNACATSARTIGDDSSWTTAQEQSKGGAIMSPQLEAVRRNGKVRSSSESEHLELLPRVSATTGSPLSDRSFLSHE
ncbi:hypothetical protein Y032_0606g580 [Ancylostoma ceylanicum]|nr:hypothetical protein Y032_0606g580 [Ancylostoma ceylanicum]